FLRLQPLNVRRNFLESGTVHHYAVTAGHIFFFEIAIAGADFRWHKQDVPYGPGNETAIFAIVGITFRMKSRNIALYDFAVTIQLPVEDIHVAVARRSPRTELDEIRLVALAGPRRACLRRAQGRGGVLCRSGKGHQPKRDCGQGCSYEYPDATA